MIHGTDGLHLGSMGQHLTTIDIADGIDTIAHLEVLIYIGITLHARLTACSHQDDVRINVSDVLNRSLHLEGDALFL